MKIKRSLICFGIVFLLIMPLLVFGQEEDLDDEVDFGKFKLVKDGNVEVNKNAGKVDVSISSGGSFEINDGEIVRYEGWAEGSLVFDGDGKLIKADLISGDARVYELVGYEFFLEEGSEVVFENGIIKIKQKSGAKISEPKLLDEDGDKVEFVFGSDGVLKLSNGRNFIGELHYDDVGFHLAERGNALVGDVWLENNHDAKLYIDFKGELNDEYPGFYYSFNKDTGKVVFGTNSETGSATITPLSREDGFELNDLGIITNENDHASWTLIAGKEGGKSYMTFQRRSVGDVVRLDDVSGLSLASLENGFTIGEVERLFGDVSGYAYEGETKLGSRVYTNGDDVIAFREEDGKLRAFRVESVKNGERSWSESPSVELRGPSDGASLSEFEGGNVRDIVGDKYGGDVREFKYEGETARGSSIYSRDGETIAFRTEDGKLRIWAQTSVEEGKRIWSDSSYNFDIDSIESVLSEITDVETYGYFENVQDGKKIFYKQGYDDVQIEKIDGFDETSTMPVQARMFTYGNDGERVSLLPENMKFIVGNTKEGFINVITDNYRYSPSDQDYENFGETLNVGAGLKKGVSNRVAYNYPSVENFERFTGIDLNSEITLTFDKYKLLIDSIEYVGEPVKDRLRNGDGVIYRNGFAYSGGYKADGWGSSSGYIEIGDRIQNDADYIIHELFHVITLGDADFLNEWDKVVGRYGSSGNQISNWASRGFTSEYGSDSDGEDIAELARFFIRSDEQIVRDFKGNDGVALNSDHEKLLAAKTAMFIVHDKLPEKELNRLRGTLKSVGIASDDKSLQTYIDKTKKEFRWR